MEARPSWRIVLAAIAACAAVTGLSGCGANGVPASTVRSTPTGTAGGTTPTGAQTTPPGISSAAAAALKLWSSFPASASPRPIVPLGGVLNPPPMGFTSGNAKLAFAQGNFRLEVPLPTAPARSDGYAIVPVGQALKTTATAGPALVVTRVTLGTATFRTDRGLRKLPAWNLYFRGGGNPATLLALAPSELFNPPAPLKGAASPVAAVGSAAASSDGRRITVGFTGGPSGSQPCDVNFSAAVATSAHAVAVSVIPHPVATPPGTACPAIAYRRQLTVHLGQPLGNRVLINGSGGAAIPVAIGAAVPGTATSPAVTGGVTPTSTG